MPAPFNKEVSSRVSSEVAETISKDFYRAMGFKAQRAYLCTYFVAVSEMGGGQKLPDILFNGTKFNNPGTFQEFIEGLPKLEYEVESLSAAVVNPALDIEGFSEADVKKGKAAVISVSVSGEVKSGEDRRVFSDSFIMVPNPEAAKNGRRDRGKREWLVSVYNSRMVG